MVPITWNTFSHFLAHKAPLMKSYTVACKLLITLIFNHQLKHTFTHSNTHVQVRRLYEPFKEALKQISRKKIKTELQTFRFDPFYIQVIKLCDVSWHGTPKLKWKHFIYINLCGKKFLIFFFILCNCWRFGEICHKTIKIFLVACCLCCWHIFLNKTIFGAIKLVESVSSLQEQCIAVYRFTVHVCCVHFFFFFFYFKIITNILLSNIAGC